jgi:DNA polymerase-3 subunit gamma/tau
MNDDNAATPYRVLARKYRPVDFHGLIGQDALVRTLTNAIKTQRLAHAFVLTGVRGVGKTTTARIIARALNCVGPDGKGGPTIEPCGQCDQCRAIAEDRHVDVLEMDAASRTGVNDIRELIEGVRYRPTSARYKIYIIDEVHMLSTAAFNALLKTLEEPPEHVKFIFATTEIRKIPVTVLSRCQRFDLKRVEMEVMAEHFRAIATKEQAEIAEGAMRLICRAADGSVRDGLSLLDQAIAHGAGKVSEEQVRDMLGLADRARIFDLFDAVMRGDTAQALAQLAEQYAVGADPAVVLQDMLELTHWLTRLKLTPDQADSAAVAETERVRGAEMAGKLSMASLTRCWQMLLKGLSETRAAPQPLQAAEMVLVRLMFAADLPSPADAIEGLRGGGSPLPPGSGGAMKAVVGGAAPQPVMHVQAQAAPDNQPRSFADVIALCSERREMVLSASLSSAVHLVKFEVGRIDIRPTPTAPADIAPRLSKLLSQWTGRPWLVSLSREEGFETIRNAAIQAEVQKKQDAANDPLVKAILETFPGATIEAVRELKPAEVEEEAPTEPDWTLGEDE